MTAPKTISHDDIAAPEIELDAEALNAIRSILTEESTPIARKVTKKSKIKGPEIGAEMAPLRRKADAFPPLESPEADEGSGAAKSKRWFSLGGKFKKIKQTKTIDRPEPVNAPGKGDMLYRLSAYRPTVMHILLACLALFVFMRPWLVIGLTILSLIVLTGVFLMVGYDGFWQNVMKMGRWYARRKPSRAAAIHARLDRFALRWDAILDRFPEGTVDALYLPDFGELAQADARHGEALDRRLAGLKEESA